MPFHIFSFPFFQIFQDSLPVILQRVMSDDESDPPCPFPLNPPTPGCPRHEQISFEHGENATPNFSASHSPIASYVPSSSEAPSPASPPNHPFPGHSALSPQSTTIVNVAEATAPFTLEDLDAANALGHTLSPQQPSLLPSISSHHAGPLLVVFVSKFGTRTSSVRKRALRRSLHRVLRAILLTYLPLAFRCIETPPPLPNLTSTPSDEIIQYFIDDE